MANAKTEAKIIFTAETSEFTEQIRQSNQAMTELRSELKLSEAQFKGNEDSVEALTEKKKILQKQLQASADKVEALRQKLESAKNIYGENSTEVSKLKTQLNNAETQYVRLQGAVNDCAQKLESQAASAGDAESALDKLKSTISAQESELSDLKSQYSDIVHEQGKTSDEAKALARQIQNLSGELNDNRTSLNNAESAADDLTRSYDDLAKAAKEQVSSGVDKMKTGFSNIGNVISGVGRTVGIVSGAVSAFVGVAVESTEEYRTAMGKVEAAFESAGSTAEVGKKTYEGFYAVLGDTDQATEAVNHLAMLTQDQKSLSDWTTICTGVYAKFGDSLPIEGLTEAANETAKTGELTGSLADALNWAGVKEDDFTKALEECNTEAEREQLIRETLNGLYGEAAEKYQETNQDLIEANKAQGNLTEAWAAFGEKVQPIVTAVKQGLADVLNNLVGLTSDVDFNAIAAAISGAFQWFIDTAIPAIKNGIQWVIDHKEIVLGIIGAIGTGILAWNIVKIVSGAIQAFTGLVQGLKVVKTAMAGVNAVMAANPILLVVAAVAALVAGIVALVSWLNKLGDNSEECNERIKAVTSTITPFKDGLDKLSPSISNVNDLTSSMGNTMSDLESTIDEKEGKITEILATAMNEQRELRDNELKSIQTYNDEIARLEQEKLQIYRKNQQIELSAILAEGEQMTQASMQQHLVNLNQTLADANTATETSYQAQLADLYTFYEAQGKVNSDEHIAAIQELNKWKDEELAVNKSHYDEGYTLLLQNAARTIEGDMDMWNEMYANSRKGREQYTSNLEQMDLDSAEAFLSMWATAKKAGTEIPAETDQMAKEMLASFDNLPSKLEEQGKLTLEGLIGGMKDEIPELEDTSEMTVDEIVDTIEKGLGIQSPSRVMKEVGSNTTQGLINGIESKKGTLETKAESIAGMLINKLKPKSTNVQSIGENIMTGINAGLNNKNSWLGSKISSLASGILSSFKSAFSINSPSRVMRDTIGAGIVEGIGVGIEENTGEVTKPINKLLNDVNGIDLSGNTALSYDVSAQLGDYVSSAINANSPYALLGSLVGAIEDLANRPIHVDVDGKTFITATAGASDSVSGSRLNLRNRGLAL